MLKYIKSRNSFENSSGTLSVNASTLKGFSYDWYQICGLFNNVLVLNNYSYSQTTSKHVWKLRQELKYITTTEIIEIEAPKGLQNIEDALNHYCYKIQELLNLMQKKGTRATTNAKRLELIKEYEMKIAFINSILTE